MGLEGACNGDRRDEVRATVLQLRRSSFPVTCSFTRAHHPSRNLFAIVQKTLSSSLVEGELPTIRHLVVG